MLSLGGSLRPGFGQGRAHLEANMAAALALQSPQEYRRWLGTYASHLSGQPLPLSPSCKGHTLSNRQVDMAPVMALFSA